MLSQEVEPRLYQEVIFNTGITKNTLVVLPTGLGKTMIAAMVAVVAGVPMLSLSAENPNAFNRLMTPLAGRNPPPAEDGIHDPESPGTLSLQAPKTRS